MELTQKELSVIYKVLVGAELNENEKLWVSHLIVKFEMKGNMFDAIRNIHLLGDC